MSIKIYTTVGAVRDAFANEDDETRLAISVETSWQNFSDAKIVSIQAPRDDGQPLLLHIAAT